MKLPTNLNDVRIFQHERDVIYAKIRKQEDIARNYRMDREDFLSDLEKWTRTALEDGVAVIHRSYDSRCETYIKKTLEAYIKTAMQEQSRFPIIASEKSGYVEVGGLSDWLTYWRLHVPKNKRLQGIVAGLLLLADNQTNKPMVVHEFRERSWEFMFFGTEGKEVLDDWLKQCRTNYIFQIAIGGVRLFTQKGKTTKKDK